MGNLCGADPKSKFSDAGAMKPQKPVRRFKMASYDKEGSSVLTTPESHKQEEAPSPTAFFEKDEGILFDPSAPTVRAANGLLANIKSELELEGDLHLSDAMLRLAGESNLRESKMIESVNKLLEFHLTRKFELGITQRRRRFLRKPTLRQAIDKLFSQSPESLPDNLIRLDLKLAAEELSTTRRTKRSKSTSEPRSREQNLESRSKPLQMTRSHCVGADLDSLYSLESSIIARPALGMQLKTAPKDEPFIRFTLRLAKIVDQRSQASLFAELTIIPNFEVSRKHRIVRKSVRNPRPKSLEKVVEEEDGQNQGDQATTDTQEEPPKSSDIVPTPKAGVPKLDISRAKDLQQDEEEAKKQKEQEIKEMLNQGIFDSFSALKVMMANQTARQPSYGGQADSTPVKGIFKQQSSSPLFRRSVTKAMDSSPALRLSQQGKTPEKKGNFFRSMNAQNSMMFRHSSTMISPFKENQ